VAAIRAHPAAWPFVEPVPRDEVPDYYLVIKDPIDLQMIARRLEADFYITSDIFIADLRRMLSNCKFYNKPDTVFYKCAEEIEERFVRSGTI